jgi:hypothetical protein
VNISPALLLASVGTDLSNLTADNSVDPPAPAMKSLWIIPGFVTVYLPGPDAAIAPKPRAQCPSDGEGTLPHVHEQQQNVNMKTMEIWRHCSRMNVFL